MRGRMLVAVVIVQVVTLGSLGLRVTDGTVEAPVLGVHLLVSCAALLGVVCLAWPDEPVNIWPDGPGEAQEGWEEGEDAPATCGITTPHVAHDYVHTDEAGTGMEHCPGVVSA